jgi:predicted peroxiredoxin
MSLLSHTHRLDTRQERRTTHRHPLLRLLIVIGLAIAAPAVAVAGGVYVAGEGVPLGQALGQALADNPKNSGQPFWVVVSGSDTGLLTKTRSNPDTRHMVRTAKDRGAEIYVCRSDLVRAGIREEELVDGVVSMYGYGQQDWSGLLPARKDGFALPTDMKQSQRILKTCAGEPKQGS